MASVATAEPRRNDGDAIAGGRRARRPLLRLLPLACAAAMVAVIAVRFDVRAILHHMRGGAWHRVLPFALGLPVVYLLLHANWDRLVLRRLLGGPRYTDLVRGRSGTALLNILGYAVGHGAFGVWLARKTGARPMRVTGAVLYVALGDLAGLGVVATVATRLGGADVPAGVQRAAVLAATVPFALAALVPRLVGQNERWARRLSILAGWRDVSIAQALVQVAGRALDLALIVFVTWQAARAFGLEIPAAAFATYMPVVLLVTSLPFNVGGLGAAQAAWLLFVPWADAEQILAFQLVWQTFFAVGIFLRGLPFLRGVGRDLRGKAPDADAA